MPATVRTVRRAAFHSAFCLLGFCLLGLSPLCLAQSTPAAPDESATPADPRVRVEALQATYEQLMDAGDIAAAVEIVEQVAELQEQLLDAAVLDAADSWMWAADLHAQLGQMDRVLVATQRCLALIEQDETVPAWIVTDARLAVEKARLMARFDERQVAKLTKVESRRARIMASYEDGDLANALREAQTAAAEMRELFGDDHLEVAKVMSNVGQLHQDMGDAAAAAEIIKSCLTTFQSAYGDHHPEYAMVLDGLAEALLETASLDEALKHATDAVEVLRSTLGDDDPDTLRAITTLATVLYKRADYDRARSLFEEVVASYQQLNGPDDPLTALALSNLGLLLRDIGELEPAEQYLRQTVDILQQSYGDSHPNTATALDNLGELLGLLGEFAESRAYLQEALAIRKQIYGERHPDVASSLYHLGTDARVVGDLPTALEYFQQSVEINRETLGPDHPTTLESVAQVGIMLQDSGNLAAALPRLEQVHRGLRKVLGDDHPDVALAQRQLGELYANLGDLDAAYGNFETALQITRDALGDSHPEVAEVQMWLGRLELAMDDFDAARRRFQTALEILENFLGPDHMVAVSALIYLAETAHAEGDLAEARSLYDRSLQISRNSLGEQHATSASILEKLAGVTHDQGDVMLARSQFEESLRIKQQALGKLHPEIAVTLGNLALVEATDGNYAAAANHVAAVRDINCQLLQQQLHRFSEQQMRQFVGSFAGTLDLLASLPLAELNRTDQGATALLFEKALAFDVLNRRRAVGRLALADPDVAAVRTELLAAQHALESITLRSGEPQQTPLSDARRSELEARCKGLEDKLTAAFADQYGDAQSITVSLDDFRRRLPTATVHVEFIRYQPLDLNSKKVEWLADRYAAAVIHSDEDRPAAWIDLGPANDIDDLVDDLSAATLDYARLSDFADEIDAEAEYRDIAAALYGKTFAPLVDAIGRQRRVFLGLDSRLHEVPFEALVDASGKYLLEEGYEFAYVNSGRDLLRTASEAPGEGVYVFAGPNYELDYSARVTLAQGLSTEDLPAANSDAAGSVPSATALALLDAPATTRGVQTRRGWQYLPGADLEGKEAAAAFASADFGVVQTFAGDEALESLVKRVRRPRVLILVTHGDFLEDAPDILPSSAIGRTAASETRGGAGEARLGLQRVADPMLRSYLVFAGANRLDETPADSPLDNGWLTAREIASLDLRGTDLVVLSACSTNRGEAANGQAVVGMRSAFLFAGARTIVGSLFVVPNVETRELMRPFYEAVAAGRGKLAALNAAKLQYMRNRRETYGAAHPFYWASFTLVGDPGPAADGDESN